MNGNPYSLSFGVVPVQLIPRFKETNEIIETFQADIRLSIVFAPLLYPPKDESIKLHRLGK